MKKYAQSLATELNHELDLIHSENTEPIEYAEKAIYSVVSVLEKLKTFFIKYKFDNQMEEITFFREIKPQFASKLIYYNEVYNIETNKTFGSVKSQRKYYSSELAKMKDFFNENLDFYKYYRTGNCCLDKKYFVRGKHDIKLTLDSFYFQADHRFSTSHDYKVAKILANDNIKIYIEEKLRGLQIRPQTHNVQTNKSTQKWTASKVALTELIYALHAEGVFNNGASDLKDITSFFEAAFSVDLGHFHRTFLDIRSRTAERTKFLTNLRDKLIIRMDNAEE